MKNTTQGASAKDPAGTGQAEAGAGFFLKTSAFGLAVVYQAFKHGLLYSLLRPLGPGRGIPMLATGALLLRGSIPAPSLIADFNSREFGFVGGGRFGEAELVEFINGISQIERRMFYGHWLPNAYDDELVALYDLRSHFRRHGRCLCASQSQDRGTGASPLRNIALFFGCPNGMPMSIWPHWGSISDPGVLHEAVLYARGLGMAANAKNLVIVTDVHPSMGRVSLFHLKGRSFVCGIPIGAFPEVDEACLKYSKSLAEADDSEAWACLDSYYLSSRVRMRFGGVDGVLVLYKDILEREAGARELLERRKRMKEVLEGARRAPKAGFEDWAASFEPFFHVRNSGNAAGFEYEEDIDAFNDTMHMCGACALFTTMKDWPDDYLLSSYRSKDQLEIEFDTSRGSLSMVNLQKPGQDSPVENEQMAMFVALCLRFCFKRELSHWHPNELCIEEAYAELSKLPFSREGGHWAPAQEPNELQKELLKALGLDDGRLRELDHYLGLG